MSPLLLVSGHAAQVVVNGLWQGTLVACTVALVLRALPGIAAAQRFAIWTFAFALAAGLPLLPAPGHGLAEGAGGVHVDPAWGAGLALLWAALVLVRLGRLLLEALRVRDVWQRATPVDAPLAVQALLGRSNRHPEFCTSEDLDVPSVIGFRSPRLLIPATHDAFAE